jgi:hypothetical protein
MTTMKDIKTCSRNGCNEHGINKTNGHGSTWYCEKHYRFRQMRSDARRRGKVVPSWEQLDERLLECLDEHGRLGKCPSCGRQMQWKSGADKKIGPTISLQHNLDGTMCFICHSCNVGHGKSKLGDLYLALEDEEKYCPRCDTVKSLEQFRKNRSRRTGTSGNCRECDTDRARKYREAKKQEVAA